MSSLSQGQHRWDGPNTSGDPPALPWWQKEFDILDDASPFVGFEKDVYVHEHVNVHVHVNVDEDRGR